MPAVPVFRALSRQFRSLFVSDAFAGVLLIVVAVSAMLAANSPWAETYHHVFHSEWFSADTFKLNTAHLWINDALMVVFFFVVGLEVKRELVSGNLADPAQRKLPVLAAAAGMAVPAAVYLAIAGTAAPLGEGWAIPAATDIAFAMGVVGLLGTRVPSVLRLFLLTVAIVDDIGAVLVIAVAYTPVIYTEWLLAAVGVAAGLLACNRAGVSRGWPYVLGAVMLWYCVLHSGVHATIAGVVAALTVPVTRRDGSKLLEDFEHALVGWNAYLVVPLFGFANAGVALAGLGLGAVLDPLPLAVGAGLVLGKQVGIFGCLFAADKLGIAPRPPGCSWAEIWGVSILTGIGFTMSLFIGELAFPGNRELIDEAKIGILVGSLVSAVLGYTVLRLVTRERTEADDPYDPVL
ncbi:Na+/H+ antiporter NhaA [Alteraurantiacibacter buctensis]|uniref:Na(+)/H(+) antiporter NhaA n=1 Tax=Alteraurantiacibacter buctensis TaxID=1503981 RepID=A0A844Z1C1_9SPHN|nr:Na+/H+ antiporter NhaA [Alteraurantiacibacter buctensis]MXO73312.1 Na+/H+ antiporter NhaA [Alteraurantiacibacter buctensis]